MAMKKPTKVITQTIELNYEDITPNPVPAVEHIIFDKWEPIHFGAPRTYRTTQKIALATTVVVTMFAVLCVGILIGAGL